MTIDEMDTHEPVLTGEATSHETADIAGQPEAPLERAMTEAEVHMPPGALATIPEDRTPSGEGSADQPDPEATELDAPATELDAPAAEPDAPAAELDAPATELHAPAAEPAAAVGTEDLGSQGGGEPSAGAPPSMASPIRVRRRVSEEIARQLHGLGARFCFTVPGESFLPLIDDLQSVGVRVVTTRHESGAAFMADALARSSGRPQLVAVSRAPGAANASIGIHAASQDSAPVIALVGQVQRAYLGREAFQEVDLVRSFGSLTQLAVQLDDPADTRPLLSRVAKRLHSGRPGPMLLSFPEDVLGVVIDSDDAPVHVGPVARGPALDRADVRQVMKLLAASERGVIVAGGGVLRARATKRLVALSEALAVPVVAAWRRPDVFPNDHPNYLGMAGPWAAPTVRPRLADADVLVFIGARLSDTTTFDYAIPSSTALWAHVDLEIDTGHADLAAPTVALEADASRFLDAAWSDLRGAALDNEMRTRREVRNTADREAWRAATRLGEGTWAGPGVHPGRLVGTLQAVLPANATLASDAGNMGGWLLRGYRFRRPGTFLATSSGAMGFGLPAAIAASLQEPDRIAVALCGDGGFAMTMMELETSVREGAHPIAIVLDNERYGTIAASQSQEGRSTATSDLGAVDFAAVARGFGALGFSISSDADFEPALREAIASRRTSVIHVKLDRAWRSVDDGPAS